MLRRKTATYALLALFEIAQQNREGQTPIGVRAGEIAQKHKLPKAYAAKILSQLANAGILHSDRGPRGGFRLNRTPESISLYDVFEGVGAFVSFDKKDQAFRAMPAAVQSTMSRAHEDAHGRLKDLFARTSLVDLINDGQPV
ncbi:MAG: Rrf2 family transcriptional regulator [Planctomycetes bacterium]|nr:Rrf2 family transcriptional regulator [Planctomycetota bacterium]